MTGSGGMGSSSMGVPDPRVEAEKARVEIVRAIRGPEAWDRPPDLGAAHRAVCAILWPDAVSGVEDRSLDPGRLEAAKAAFFTRGDEGVDEFVRGIVSAYLGAPVSGVGADREDEIRLLRAERDSWYGTAEQLTVERDRLAAELEELRRER